MNLLEHAMTFDLWVYLSEARNSRWYIFDLRTRKVDFTWMSHAMVFGYCLSESSTIQYEIHTRPRTREIWVYMNEACHGNWYTPDLEWEKLNLLDCNIPWYLVTDFTWMQHAMVFGTY